MKRELRKFTVLMTAPILLSLAWNIHASDKAPSSDTRVKTAQPDTISVPHTAQLDSLSKALSDSIHRRVRISILEHYKSHYKSNTRDLLLRPADKATYTTSDLLLRPDDNINSIFISRHPARVQRRVYPGASDTPYRLTPVAHQGSAKSEDQKEP